MRKILYTFFVIALTCFAIQCSEEAKESETVPQQNTADTNLPDIQQFRSNPSDRFLVDIETIIAGHPFKGKRANQPHQGAHTHWDNRDKLWPKGGTLPSNYPVIYAVADGYITRIDYKLQVGTNDRYGVELAFAKNDTSIFLFCCGIEPMVPEPSVDFYRQFITVSTGQQVKKGDTLAYMFLPDFPAASHIHFHISQQNKNNFLAPAIFKSAIVDSFYTKWGIFAYDDTTQMPSCMGYMLDADENPFGTGNADTLK
jgi:hypothetical protein